MRCRAKAEQDDGVTRKVFMNFQEEVEKLGVSAMEYKLRRTIENDKLVKLGMRPLKVRQWPTAKTNYMRGTYPYASPLYTFLSQADTASGRASEHPTARTLISD